ncbi:hypothetical protein N6G95_06030 [Pediococcus inopinatus]|uniref:hypothetical protein n=1 Tax=Pediococcus inopinatus TaxID=114090 RepID=UPI002B25F153|nr:hypothetical protein [Pediococcus inopinatus]WPC18802.1 hypothetical protein N6G95_06030 [Pediococcus inopinatus]
MTIDSIVGNIVSEINMRLHPRTDGIKYQFERCTFPVTFTRDDYKEADGCAIFLVETDGSYTVTKFESRYMDVEDPLRKVYHGAYFECDEEPTAMDELIEDVAAGVSKN